LIAFLRGVFLHNFGLKALSLCAAFVLWAVISTEPELETFISVPVEFRNMPSDLEFAPDQDSTVYLQVKGPSGRLRSITHADVAVVLDLARVREPGTRTFTLDSSRVILPRGVRLIKSTPSQLRLVFERRAARAVPVVPRFTGIFPSGYVISSYAVDPPALKIVGPESRVALLDHAVTDPIQLSGVNGTASFTTNAYLPDPRLRFENLHSVRVTVEMKKR
jgi:YbbR domain-containing protein